MTGDKRRSRGSGWRVAGEEGNRRQETGVRSQWAVERGRRWRVAGGEWRGKVESDECRLEGKKVGKWEDGNVTSDERLGD